MFRAHGLLYLGKPLIPSSSVLDGNSTGRLKRITHELSSGSNLTLFYQRIHLVPDNVYSRPARAILEGAEYT